MAGSGEKISDIDLDEMEIGDHEEAAYSSDDNNFLKRQYIKYRLHDINCRIQNCRISIANFKLQMTG